MLAVAYRPLEQMQACSVEMEDFLHFSGDGSHAGSAEAGIKTGGTDGEKSGHPSGYDHGRSSGYGSGSSRKTGILEPGDLTVTGQELERMTDGELDRKLASISVYARVSPEHKIRIVEAWQRQGRIVAMTGAA